MNRVELTALVDVGPRHRFLTVMCAIAVGIELCDIDLRVCD